MIKRFIKTIFLALIITIFVGCLNSGKKENLCYKNKPVDDAVIQRFYELLIKSDMDGIIKLFDEHEDLDINEKYFQDSKKSALAVALTKRDVLLAEFLMKGMKANEEILLDRFYLSEAFKAGNTNMASYILRKAKEWRLCEANRLLCWAINENKLDIVRQVIEILDVKHPVWNEYIKNIFFEIKSLEVAKLLESYKIGLNDSGYIQLNAFIGLLIFDGYFCYSNSYSYCDSYSCCDRDRDTDLIACYFMDKCSKEYLEYLWENIKYASYPEVLKRFIKIGVDINMRKGKWWGRTELVSAVINNKVEAVKLLLEAGADANILDRNKRSALFYALEKDEISKEMIDILISKTKTIHLVELINFLEINFRKRKNIPLIFETLFKKGLRIIPFPKTGKSIFEICKTFEIYNALMDGLMSQHLEMSIDQKKEFRRKAFFKYKILSSIMKNMHVYISCGTVDGRTEGLEKCLEDAGLSINTILENGNSIFMKYCVKLRNRLKIMQKVEDFEELEKDLIKFKTILEGMVNLRPNANIRNLENATCIGCLMKCWLLFNEINPENLKNFNELNCSFKSLIMKILTNRYLELINEAGIMYQEQELKESHLNAESALKLVGTYTDIDEETKEILEKALFEGSLPERIEYMNCREILDYALSKNRY